MWAMEQAGVSEGARAARYDLLRRAQHYTDAYCALQSRLIADTHFSLLRNFILSRYIMLFHVVGIAFVSC